MKKIILTIDYELFLGVKTGTVRECMIEPTIKLASIVEKNGSKMTIFWDILHYYRLLELENSYSELKQDRLLIEEQIIDLARRGHDIQLHLHTQWLDSKYEDGRWKFLYDRYKLHNLLNENNIGDINTITGCISFSIKIMHELIKNVNPNYKVTTFRAGGHLIEPFSKIKDALLSNEIKIDSSVCPGLYNKNGIYSYDFRYYPLNPKYNFAATPKIIVDEGSFIEIPITTIKLPLFRNLYYKFLIRVKYSTLDDERKGIGAGTIEKKKIKNKLKRLFSIFFMPQRVQFTTDSKFRENFNYMYKKAPEYATMIIHPKLLNSHTLGILDGYVTSKKIQFISIKDFIN